MSGPLKVLSLGAGVQSSTMALMSACGDLEMPDCAIFADTGDEPAAVYDWLAWLEGQLPFPIHKVSIGRLSDLTTKVRKSAKSGNGYLSPSIPAFILGEGGKKGMQMRQCTRSAKIDPINRKIRELAQVKRGEKTVRARVFIGISTDEAARMKPAGHPWLTNEWPLIDAGVSRKDCLDWMQAKGFPVPPRSACIYCPYHSDAEWVRLRQDDPAEFQKAVAFEKKLQGAYDKASALTGVPFLHSQRVPLNEVNFSPDKTQPDLFQNECEGMCGV